MCVESQDASWIRGLCKRVHPLNAPSTMKLFMALVAYMDDSGSHVGAPNSLVAGYWGGEKEWRAVEWKWKSVLGEFGIDEFHAKQFWPRPEGKRLGPFSDWDDERHHAFVDKLLRVIESSNIVPFSYGVSAEAWQNRSDYWKRIFVGPGFGKGRAHDPLFLSFQVAISKTATYCKPGKIMHFVYDLDSKNSGRFAEWYRDFKHDNESVDSGLGDLIFADSKQALPLQVADLLGYEAYRYKKGAKGDPNAPIRDEYKRALCHLRTLDDFWLFDEPRLRNLERHLAAAAEHQMTANTGS